MTIVVSIKVTDGLVLASDSATTFSDRDGVTVKVYNNANKVFNLVKGYPVGAMTYGSGAIGTASIATLSKDLRRALSDPGSPHFLDLSTYTMRDVALQARTFMADRMREAYPDGAENFFMGYRLFGYSAQATLAEGYELYINGAEIDEPERIYELESYGPRWAGDGEALNRLILGYSSELFPALHEVGLPPENDQQLLDHLSQRMHRLLFLPAMPIQDAIDLARFLAETAARFSHFSMSAATIGGPIEIATISKHEGFKWVARKHYFTSDLNPP